MNWNGDKMHMIRTLGRISLITAMVAVGGCDDDDDDDTGGTSATTGVTTATDTTTDDTMGSEESESESDATSEGESSGGGTNCDEAPSHAAVIQPIWDASCVAGCHEPGGTWQSVDLSSGMAFDAIVEAQGTFGMAVGLNLVEPGSSADSLLVQKLRGTQAAAAGQQMPLPAEGSEFSPLPEAQITLIEQWIDCGANP